MNCVSLTGRITKMPELKFSTGGRPYVNFTLAVPRSVKNQSGQDADFVSCTAWGKTAETICRYLGKGSRIGVEGRISTSSYEKNRQKVYSTIVQVERFEFLDTKGAQDSAAQNGTAAGTQPSYQSGGYPDSGIYGVQENSVSPYDDFGVSDEDLPF